MTTVSLSFPGPLSTKRRRMRSGGGATLNNNNASMNGGDTGNSNNDLPSSISIQPQPSPPPQSDDAMNTGTNSNYDEENISEQKTTQTSKCKGATTIPIFLKKTYKMVDTCDPSIASWTEDGDMFVVKDPDLFATNVIPQYFDHNKFSSFARQLNFYGFRKMQSKPIRNSDFDISTSKYVTFFNENFKRGRCDLLKKIQRSTRGGGTTTPMDQSRELVLLRDQVSNLEQQISEITEQTEERIRRLELEMLSRLEQMTMSIQRGQHYQLEKNTSIGSILSGQSAQQLQQQSMSMPAPLPQTSTYPNSNMVTQQQQQQMQQQTSMSNNNWDTNTYNNLRGSSVASNANSVANIVGNPMSFLNMHQQQQQQPQQQQVAPPTLPPHPKQKQFASGIVSNTTNNNTVLPPPDRMNSLRGISTLSRGISGLTRGASVESSASAVLLRNSWEDKFFSMLMLEANDQGMTESNMLPTPIGIGPVTVSEQTGVDLTLNSTPQPLSQLTQPSQQSLTPSNINDEDELSDVSSGDLP